MFPRVPSICLIMLPKKARHSSPVQWSLLDHLSLPGILEEQEHWGLYSSVLLQSSRTPFHLKIFMWVGNSFWPYQYKQHKQRSQGLRMFVEILCDTGDLF